MSQVLKNRAPEQNNCPNQMNVPAHDLPHFCAVGLPSRNLWLNESPIVEYHQGILVWLYYLLRGLVLNGHKNRLLANFFVRRRNFHDNNNEWRSQYCENVEQPAQTGPMWSPIEPLSRFEILVRESADSLEAFLRAAIDDYSAADDLFQETMLIAWRKIGDYDRTRPFGA